MSKTTSQTIEVYANWHSLKHPILMGQLFSANVRGKEIFSFEYDTEWLYNKNAQIIDPALKLLGGKQYSSTKQANFGVFLDSSPDRWGRMLMNRREALTARDEDREERKLLESDYLLGVFDKHRMGALRFRTDPNGPFLDNNKMFASPPWTTLRELEHASLELEKTDAEDNPSYSKWLKMLIAPGGSLGGARPKASIIDEKNHLWIAKFPSLKDQYNIGAWEMVAFNLAKKSGITIAESRVERFNNEHHTFLSKRFDRIDDEDRIHFASAMTLLQYLDGDDSTIGVSYLELAEFIIQYGTEPTKDLEQLWRRIVFSICISNVDDHLRNHGFILQAKGWKLSPAFDINPDPDGDGLKLNISENDNSQDLSVVNDVAEYFHLSPKRANEILQAIVNEVKTWRSVATSLGISKQEQNRMASAFRVADNF